MTQLCQYCLERQLPPNEAIGLYCNLPICDPCLSPIMDNMTNVAVDEEKKPAETLEERKLRALALLDKFEEIFENWPLTADEVLKSRDDFFNHRPPAIINCTQEQITEMIGRRKAVLYSFKIKDEYWTRIIEDIKTEKRRLAGLEGVKKSLSEKGKIVKSSGSLLEQQKKLAKMMNVDLATIQAMGSSARQEEFKGILGTKEVKTVEAPKESVKSILSELQDKVKNEPNKIPGTVTRCQNCKKITCICRR